MFSTNNQLIWALYLFYQKQSKYAMNIGVAEIRGALDSFYLEKVPFYISQTLLYLSKIAPDYTMFILNNYWICDIIVISIKIAYMILQAQLKGNLNQSI